MDITTCIRFHDAEQIRRLERCISSLRFQTLKPRKILIATQSFSEINISRVENLCKKIGLNGKAINCKSKYSHEDLRSKLLNTLLNESDTDFIHFLDFDDYLYQHAYESFNQECLNDCHSSLIYFCRVERGFFATGDKEDILLFCDNPYATKTSKADLVVDNFCPIHSYVINKKHARNKGIRLYFNEEYEALEDYDFLLRYSKEKYNFRGLEKIVGIYCFRDDCSNTTIVNNSSHNKENNTNKNAKWSSGRERIKLLKQSMGLLC